jgi:transmembrane sensor
MASADRQRLDEALDWVRRLHDPAFAEWDAHVVWLEADPRNAAAFDAASVAIEDATRGLAPARPPATSPMPINDNAPKPEPATRRRTRWGTGLGVAVAAGLAAVVAIPAMMPGKAQPYAIRTAPGERRSIMLNGTSIALNGDSSLRLDRADPRVAVLERGEAYFTVRHDAAHPFSVHAGDATFRDVGTAFDVVRRDGATQIAVREGAVLYDPGGAAVRLDGGQAMRIAGGSAMVEAVDTAAIGGWRSGRLLYRNATLADIAQDVARTIGVPVSVDPALAQRRFSGVVMIDADRARMFRRMAAVMGVAMRRDAEGWQMVTPAR